MYIGPPRRTDTRCGRRHDPPWIPCLRAPGATGAREATARDIIIELGSKHCSPCSCSAGSGDNIEVEGGL